MAADDERLARMARRYRLESAAIQARAEAAMMRAWRSPDFGMVDANWIRWANAHPRELQLRLTERGGRPSGISAPAWEQLKLALDGEQLSLWSDQALRTSESAQYQTALATQRYLAGYSAAVRDSRLIVPGISPSIVSTEALRGVPATVVWERPVSTFRIALWEGKPVQAARELAAQRTSALLATGTQLAHVQGAIRYFRDRGERENIVGYRRVPRGGRSCALCLLASTQRYHRKDLMPIHDHCHCVVEPIYGDRDPGQVIEPVQLKAVHAQVAAATGSSDLSGGHYRDVVIVHNHGEIGPVLTYRDHAFTGPSDLASSN